MQEAISLPHPFVAQGIVLVQARISGEWGVTLPQRPGAFFHFCLEGRAYLSAVGKPDICLEAGDIILVPQGLPHTVSSGIDSPVVGVEAFLAQVNGKVSSARKATSIVCGFFGPDTGILLTALNDLPAFVHLEACNSALITENLKQLRDELRRSEFGSQPMIRHLLSTIFIYILREWERLRGDKTNILSLAQRRQIAIALACIHERPFYQWTIEGLAMEAGLSRTVFAQRFAQSVGETPHAYLTRFRMGLATQMLKDTDESIAQIARRSGYSSQYSFSKAFKDASGFTPGQVRGQRAAAKAAQHQG